MEINDIDATYAGLNNWGKEGRRLDAKDFQPLALSTNLFAFELEGGT
jgi:hypothetical protein